MDWNLYVRDRNGNRVAEVDDFRSAKLVPAYNDVGNWSLTLGLNSPAMAYLAQPGAGLVACRNDVPLVSGPQRGMNVVKSSTDSSITFTGFTDETWLDGRAVSPSPTESVPPYSLQDSDNRSGVASTIISQYVDVNAGPGAIPQRQVPGLTIGIDPLIGPTVSGVGRWNTSVLAFIQPMATSAGIGFRVVQVGNSYQFQVYQPVDRTGTVKFSEALGNLAGMNYSITAAKSNYEYVGGAGTGKTRLIEEFSDQTSIGNWGRIEGAFIDRGDTSDTTVLAQAGADALSQNSDQMSLALTPIETPNLKYGEHYFLGDKISVQLQESIPSPYGETGTIKDILRTVTINLTKDEVSVRPALGTPARADILRIFTTLRSYRDRLNKLERS